MNNSFIYRILSLSIYHLIHLTDKGKGGVSVVIIVVVVVGIVMVSLTVIISLYVRKSYQARRSNKVNNVM